MKLRIAGAQIPVTPDIAANCATIEAAIDFAANQKADILVTPEGSLSNYTHRFDQPATAAALEKVTARARQANLALALGTCFIEPADNLCYNQLRFYNRRGEYLGFHAKILRCGTVVGPQSGEINHYATVPLRTFNLDGLTVGGLICNDMWANPGCTPMDDPHLTQQHAAQGVRVIFHAVNGGRATGDSQRLAWQYHEANLRLRAKAGRLYIATVDNCHPADLPCAAPSGILGPDGAWQLQTKPQGQEIFVHTIDLPD